MMEGEKDLAIGLDLGETKIFTAFRTNGKLGRSINWYTAAFETFRISVKCSNFSTNE
jgi:hypothetical protein